MSAPSLPDRHAVPAARATRVRCGVVGLAIALAMVTYLDRACIATLAPAIMRVLGINHEKLTYRYAGRDFRLTDVYGEVVRELLV